MNLSRVLCNEYLDSLSHLEHIIVNRTAGLDMIYPHYVPQRTEILKAHYLSDRPKHILIENSQNQ